MKTFILLVLTTLVVTASCAGGWYRRYGIADEAALADPASGPALVRAFADSDPKVRLAAINAFRRLDRDLPGAKDALRNRLYDRNPAVAVAAIEALAARGEPRSSLAAPLVNIILSDNPNARRLGILAHRRLGYVSEDSMNALQTVAAGDVHRGLRPLAASVYRYVTVDKFRSQKGIVAAGRRVLPDTGCRPRPHDLAVIIGIEAYRNIAQRSRFSVDDAATIRRALTEMCIPERNIQYLIGDDATLSAFRRVFEAWLPNRSSAKGTVIVYYSGHGAPDAAGNGYLLPVDADPAYLAQTAYPLQGLYDRLASIEARERIVLIDSCFSGAGGRSVLPPNTRPVFVEAKEPLLPAAGMAVLTASSSDQISSVLADKGHGTFTYYLIEALKKGNYTLPRIYAYLAPAVEDAAKKGNVEQRPRFFSSSAGGSMTLLPSPSE